MDHASSALPHCRGLLALAINGSRFFGSPDTREYRVDKERWESLRRFLVPRYRVDQEGVRPREGPL